MDGYLTYSRLLGYEDRLKMPGMAQAAYDLLVDHGHRAHIRCRENTADPAHPQGFELPGVMGFVMNRKITDSIPMLLRQADTRRPVTEALGFLSKVVAQIVDDMAELWLSMLPGPDPEHLS